MIKLAKDIYYWAPRLPFRFTIPFLALLFLWLFLAAWLLQEAGMAAMADLLAKLIGLKWLIGLKATGSAFSYPIIVIHLFFESFVSLLIFLIVIQVSYNLAALFYRRFRKHPPGKVHIHQPVPPKTGSGKLMNEFKKRYNLKELRIGLILAGGGAKGAYQAGAMKAIYEFLEENNALDKVRMVAGTSIGSWNAMFWLAGLVKAPAGNAQSAHEQWWCEISVERIMEFATYILLRKNHFLKTTPWQETFERMFVEETSVNQALTQLFSYTNEKPPVHFYFTRSNVELGRLEFATNNQTLPKLMRKQWASEDIEEPVIPSDRYELIGEHVENPLGRLKLAVFASMDLPPLFPYMCIRTDKNEWFEDGGVVENLPLRFATEIEHCNLLFVLPLNASFAEEVSHDSIIKRLIRVMDVRQGVLERNSIKLARLYNDIHRLENELDQLKATPEETTSNSLLSVFAICPEQPLIIGTAEFWKPKEAGKAFDLMYSATRTVLNDNFITLTNPNRLRMTLIGPQGQAKILEDF